MNRRRFGLPAPVTALARRHDARFSFRSKLAYDAGGQTNLQQQCRGIF
jgi:hypothetical protein